MRISAKYPNSTAFQAEIAHRSLGHEHREALLGVRLNTSRLLHTRLSWRPELMKEVRLVFLDRAVEEALNARVALAEMNEAISNEVIHNKYFSLSFIIIICSIFIGGPSFRKE